MTDEKMWYVPVYLMWIFVFVALVAGGATAWMMKCPCADASPQYVTVVTPEACAALEGREP